MRRLALLLICVLFVTPAAAQFSFLGIKNSLVEFVFDQISVPGEMEIAAEGVEDEEGATVIVGLTVSDRDGIWLRVERVAVDWTPSRVLAGELDLARLAATGVDVRRAPAPGAVEVEVKEGSTLAKAEIAPFEWPRSPVPMNIEALSLTDVTIAAGVFAEQGLAFDAEGAAKDSGDEQSVRLTLTRKDATEGAVILSSVRDFETNRFDLSLTVEEAPGGLISEFAGFPPESASRLALTGSGPLSDWSLALDLTADDVIAAKGTATLDATERFAARGDFTLTPGKALDPAATLVLSPETKIAFDLLEGDDGLIRVQEGSITAENLSLDASGTVERVGFATDLAVRLDAGGGLSALVEGASFAGIRFEGGVVGPPADITATGRLTLDRFASAAVDIGAASLDAKIRSAEGTIDATLGGEASALRLDRLSPELVGTARLMLDATYGGDAATLRAFRLEAAPLTVSAAGVVDLKGAETALTYALSAPALAPLAAAYDVAAGGALTASGALAGALSGPQLSGEVLLAALTYGADAFGDLRLTHHTRLGAVPEGSAVISLTDAPFGQVDAGAAFRLEETLLRLTGFDAAGLGARIKGAATVDLEKTLVDGALTLAARDIAPLSGFINAPASGAISGDLVFRVEDGAQNVDLDLALVGIAAKDIRLAEGTLTARLQDALGAPRAEGRLTVNGASAAGMTLTSLDLSGTATELTSAPKADLSFKASGADLGAARVGTLEGTLKGGAEDARLVAALGGVAADGASIRAVRLDARAEEAASGDPRLTATVTVDGVAAGDATLSRTTLTAAGRLSALDLTLDTAGEAGGEAISLATAARAALTGDAPSAAISRLIARYGEAEVSLRSPLAIKMESGTTRITGLDLALPGGGLTGKAALHPAGLEGDLALSITDISPLASLANAPLQSGAFDVTARLDTRPGRTGAKVIATGRGLKLDDVVADVGNVDIDAGVDWNGSRADVTAAISGPFGDPIRIAAALPLRSSGGAFPSVPPSGALSGSVNWVGDISALWALVPAPGHVLGGETRVALTLGGTVSKPAFGGDIAISNGRYENLDVGSILINLNANSRIEPNGAFVVELNAEDGSGGPVNARVSLNNGTLDASVGAKSATLVRRDDVTAILSLDITAKGPVASPSIAGRVEIERAEIRLVAATPPSVVDLGPVRIKGEEPPVVEESDSEAIPLRVDIVAPDEIFVRGRGLDSEWMADLKVRGFAARPRITGAINKRRGLLSFLGAQLELERGEIRFFGGRTINPRLDILLQRENDGVRGGVAVTGTANDPVINFVSRPALPEEEVLPRILFGRSQQSLSPTEAVSLAIGVATLLDGSGGSVDGVRSALGVDVLRLDDGEDGPSVSVGSNLTDGVYVGAKQPIGGGAASLEVEIEVFDDFTINSEVGPDVGTAIGLNWKKDF